MTISAFSRRSWLSHKALRLYDRNGLLSPSFVDPKSGYRMYRETQLPTARLISLLRRIDMPITRIKAILDMPDEDRSAAIASYWHDVEVGVAVKREIVSLVRNVALNDETAVSMYKDYKVLVRDIEEQTMLSAKTHVQADELPQWLGGAMGELHERAKVYGGVAGRRSQFTTAR